MKFDLKSIYNGHFNSTYKGIDCLKCPFDYLLYQMIIWEVKPDLIIEIGTRSGGSTLYLADLLEVMGNGLIHTIDVSSNNENKLLHNHSRITIFKEGYENYDTQIIKSYSSILIIDDGSHMYQDTLNALHKFAPFVSLNSYFIVEDGIITNLGLENRFKGGPTNAIKDFLKINKKFSIERKWCDFYGTNTTFNVNGYLKRIF